jgi:BirA family biotin operon repressor/biotin-[acetyl-CoA-carboxylase] ligase
MDELELAPLTLHTFVRQIRALESVDSTNTAAVEWSPQLTADELPALVITERQTSGRGRGVNRWWSAPGALTFSLLIEPGRHGIPTLGWPALSLTVGAAAATALREQLPRAELRLKWPNDVYLNGRKVAGILIESPPATPHRLVVGIGINVNNSLDSAPEEVRARAAAACDAAGGPVSRTAVLAAVLQQLERDIGELANASPRLPARWRELCLLTGGSVVVTDSGRTIAGTCLGLDDDGALRVQTGRSIERLFSGVVTEFG